MSKLLIFLIAMFIAIGGGAYWYVSQIEQVLVKCGEDVRLCPDGSYIRRIGPDCKFASCQGALPDLDQIACTMEAKLCPDGSYVGRTGPNCEFTACPDTNNILPYNSGIRGTVMLGPTCPVERIPPDPNCVDKPYQTTVVASRASDPTRVILSINSDESGAFSMSLPPGEYVLNAGEGDMPYCSPTTVVVELNVFASTIISCDTGIR